MTDLELCNKVCNCLSEDPKRTEMIGKDAKEYMKSILGEELRKKVNNLTPEEKRTLFEKSTFSKTFVLENDMDRAAATLYINELVRKRGYKFSQLFHEYFALRENNNIREVRMENSYESYIEYLRERNLTVKEQAVLIVSFFNDQLLKQLFDEFLQLFDPEMSEDKTLVTCVKYVFLYDANKKLSKDTIVALEAGFLKYAIHICRKLGIDPTNIC